MHYTGTEKVVLNLASMMQKQGHKVKVICYSFYEDSFYDEKIGCFLIKRLTYENISILALKHIKKYAPLNIDFSLHDKELSQIAEQLILSEKPDIIHVMHLMRVHELLYAANRLNIPYIITLTDFWLICPNYTLVNSKGDLCGGPNSGSVCKRNCWEFKPKRIIERLNTAREVLQNAQMVTAPSKFLASIMRNQFPQLEIQVINHGLNYTYLKKCNKSYHKGDKIVFCYAGSLNYHKGVHVIIKAFSKIKDPQASLKIYGSGDKSYTKQLKNSVRDGRIEFCGVYNEKEIADIFGEIDIMIISSLWYETYSLIMHEALTSFIPVAASNVGVMNEKIIDNYNGFTFKIGDPNHLNGVMRRIIDNPEMLNTIKQNIKDTFIPTIEQEAYTYEKIYQDIVQNVIFKQKLGAK